MPEPSVAHSSTETVGAAHSAHVPLAEVTRGSAVESIHYGSVAVVDREGRLLAAAGDPTFLTMTRSSLKPFQAMPFVAAGGPERFGYSKAQIALLCASHSGEPRHVEAVADMLARAGNSPGHLQCGTHAPYYYEVSGEVPPPPPYSPLAHNCSGKHSGMLAHCVQCGYPRDSYLAVDHPLQQ
ncbi:MAG TPA: asparaginase, partial [Casimicrobiaceae bacterium]|nr:asparaginase [Casimicrobiaceae bacterium]